MLIAGFIPSAGFVVAIIGFILILIAVKYVSDAFTDRTIFNNMIIAVILAILGFVAFFLKRSYDTVAMKLNVGMFHTTGLLYLIGAALTIIFVGLVIVFIAEILQIVAFFSIPEQMPMGPQPMPGQMGTPPPRASLANAQRSLAVPYASIPPPSSSHAKRYVDCRIIARIVITRAPQTIHMRLFVTR